MGKSKKTFGELLRDARTARGMSQFDLSIEAHIGVSELSKLENDSRGTPNLSTFSRLTMALVLTADEIETMVLSIANGRPE